MFNDKSNVFVSKQELNITPTASADCLNSQNLYTANINNRSSFSESNYDDGVGALGYSSNSGYGLIDASKAVAKSVGQNTFADVPDLGGNNWGDDLVKAPESWAKGYTGQGVVVAVLDTGVDINHEDLKNNIWTNTSDDNQDGYVDDIHGWNFVDDNNDVMDRDGHGTHVSGSIAAERNDKGATGVAYNAKIMPVKVLDDNGSGSYDNISKGIYYAVDHGADIINLSLGGGGGNKMMQDALEYASNKGVIVVMAAGNSGASSPIYPARYAEKTGVAVGAVDRDGSLASFSNRAGNKELTYVTAPGVSIYSTVPDNGYASYSGTSMATPHAVGVIALMLSANNSLSDSQVRQILADTSGNSGQSGNTIPSFNFGDIFSGFNPFSNRLESTSLSNRYNFTTGFGSAENNVILDANGKTTNGNAGMDLNVNINNGKNSSTIYNYGDSSTLPNTSNLMSSDMPQYWGGTQSTSYDRMASTNPSDPENIFKRYSEILMAPYQDYIRLIPNK